MDAVVESTRNRKKTREQWYTWSFTGGDRFLTPGARRLVGMNVMPRI
jgi:hypothetical protein